MEIKGINLIDYKLPDCIVCLKLGDRYSSEYVNNLYKSVRKYCDMDFLCYTDDWEGIDDDVLIVPFKGRIPKEEWTTPENLLHKETSLGWWPAWAKLELFAADELKNYNRKIFFDLDIVIQNDITPILEYETDWAIIDSSYWKGENWIKDHPKGKAWNSSCIIFKDNEWVYDRYQKNWENFVKEYAGIDDFFNGEHFKPDLLPPWFYSYAKGSKPEHYYESISKKKPYNKYQSDFLICLFHQKPDIHELDSSNILYKLWTA